MKKQIPSASQFINDNIENLSLLKSMGDDLDGIGYRIFAYSPDMINIYDVTGKYEKIIERKQINEVTELDEKDKEVIIEILAAIDDNGMIILMPKRVEVCYMMSRGDTTMLVIRTEPETPMENSKYYYTEMLHNSWWVEIMYSPKG
jgi:hypothetical protein